MAELKCKSCGGILTGGHSDLLNLRCSNCYGPMEQDADKAERTEEFVCPECGAKEWFWNEQYEDPDMLVICGGRTEPPADGCGWRGEWTSAKAERTDEERRVFLFVFKGYISASARSEGFVCLWEKLGAIRTAKGGTPNAALDAAMDAEENENG